MSPTPPAGRAATEFRILGALDVRRDGRQLRLGRGKLRSLLALLLLHRNEVVPSEQLIDDLWGEDQPRTARTALQGHVAQLRKALGHERLLSEGRGYLLVVEHGELDAERFELLLGAGRFDEALELWRGAALSDCPYDDFAQAEIGRLEELRLVALERRLEAAVDAGRAAEAVPDLEALVGEHPFRERPRSLLMLALYRAGRQAGALAAYQDTRRAFRDELGLEPSAELKQLQKRILARDAALAALDVPEAENGVRAERRTVTIASADLVGSATFGERLDPAAYHSLVERFAKTCTDAIERHGGAVTELADGAVTGAFGLTQAHEDDTLCALRAGLQIAEALAPLELQARIGVATGELLADWRLGGLDGAAVNVAATPRGQAQA